MRDRLVRDVSEVADVVERMLSAMTTMMATTALEEPLQNQIQMGCQATLKLTPLAQTGPFA